MTEGLPAEAESRADVPIAFSSRTGNGACDTHPVWTASYPIMIPTAIAPRSYIPAASSPRYGAHTASARAFTQQSPCLRIIRHGWPVSLFTNR